MGFADGVLIREIALHLRMFARRSRALKSEDARAGVTRLRVLSSVRDELARV